jgi:acyl-CoA dehydrogenase
MSNAVRALVFGLTGGRGIDVPTDGPTRRYYQQLTRYSSAFAFAADVSMLVLGGSLKRREKISARLGDVLSQMYLCSAVLKRFEDDGRPDADLPLLHWSMQDGIFKIQEAFDGVLQNFPSRLAAWMLRKLIFPLGKCMMPPSDMLGHQVATLMMQPGAARDRLTSGMYLAKDEQDAIGSLELALLSTLQCEPMQAMVAKARKEGKIKSRDELEQISEAVKLGVLTADQQRLLERDYALRRKVIMVNDFDPSEMAAG